MGKYFVSKGRIISNWILS